MRAIGFSEYTDRKKLKELLTDVIMNSDHESGGNPPWRIQQKSHTH